MEDVEQSFETVSVRHEDVPNKPRVPGRRRKLLAGFGEGAGREGPGWDDDVPVSFFVLLTVGG